MISSIISDFDIFPNIREYNFRDIKLNLRYCKIVNGYSNN